LDRRNEPEALKLIVKTNVLQCFGKPLKHL
jgi:hypothetical protein